MTSELRPAVAVWADALLARHEALQDPKGRPNKAATAVIEAYGDQREAKWKALAETLAGALEPVEQLEVWSDNAADSDMVILTVGTVRKMREALTSYKEQRDAS